MAVTSTAVTGEASLWLPGIGSDCWFGGKSVMRGGLITVERPTRKTPIVTPVGL